MAAICVACQVRIKEEDIVLQDFQIHKQIRLSNEFYSKICFAAFFYYDAICPHLVFQRITELARFHHEHFL